MAEGSVYDRFMAAFRRQYEQAPATIVGACRCGRDVVHRTTKDRWRCAGCDEPAAVCGCERA